ncbi:hypothetical protein HY256_07615 [Candidatus Sumerlaeota bacterium]|nr:hypothetical protein [Candidatus Sumerlaeota bacterium]
MAALDPLLMEILVCPENKTPVRLAEEGLIAKLNAAQREGKLKNRAGGQVKEPLDGGLIRQDNAILYPIIEGIPVMLKDDGIPLAGYL